MIVPYIETSGRGASLLKKYATAGLNFLTKAIAIISVLKLLHLSCVLINSCITTWKMDV